MTRIENRCCDCSTPGYPCLGRSCSLLKYEATYCDRCGKEIHDKNYGENGEDVCFFCHEAEEKEEEEEEEEED